jgi:hypothetical protein
MKKLEKKYKDRLDEIINNIQGSEVLSNYLDEEDEENYKLLIEGFEPEIEALYEEVANEQPLQLIALEDALLDDGLEGLFMPRLLGYNMLRGEINDSFKFVRSQENVGKVLNAICNNSNFDYLTHRIGQSVQIAFALSSDIWSTSFIEKLPSKRQKQYLLAQKLEKYLHVHERKAGYNSYSRQFSKFNFYTTEFPVDLVQQKALFYELSSFLKHRAEINQHNDSFIPEFIEYLDNEVFHFTKEHTIILGLVVNYFDLIKADQKKMSIILNKLRDADNFNDVYFSFLFERFNSRLKLNSDSDKRVAALVDFKKADDDLTRYYSTASVLASKGFIHEDSIEAVRATTGKYEGMSLFNDCLRRLVLGYFTRLISNLEVDAYQDYFEMDKYFRTYMDIFANEQFNQDLKALSMKYLKSLLNAYPDKRGRDYQDLKKFFTAQFREYGFLKDKDIAEIFKSKRVRKDV